MRVPTFSSLAVLSLAVVLGCGSDASNPSAPTRFAAGGALVTAARPDLPEFDPSSFVSEVTNPFFPLPVGRVTTFESEDGSETIVVEVLAETKIILGVSATVVRDRVYENGVLIEDTYDWFAQDTDGNVWYLGEAVQNFEDGVPTNTDGSWEAGVDGAVPGIIMLAEPAPGDAYYQELAEGVAEDQARVRRTGETVTVPYGTFENALQILEWTALEPGAREYKYYVEGIGVVLEARAGSGKDRVELVSVTGV